MQNQCLRVVTGAHAAASMQHLHHETLMLPIEDHLNLLCQQYLAKTLVRSHPSFEVATAPSGPRLLRHTLSSRYLESVRPFFVNDEIPSNEYRNVLTDLHTAAVESAIRKLDAKPNRVLGARPPSIDSSESYLPRSWRSTLSQLRSGFCRSLNSYQAIIGGANPLCPECNLEEQTVPHLFNCPSRPSRLYKLDLWCNPVHAAAFLSSLPYFSHLPPVASPSTPPNPHPVLRPPPAQPPPHPQSPPPPVSPILPPPPPEPPPRPSLSSSSSSEATHTNHIFNASEEFLRSLDEYILGNLSSSRDSIDELLESLFSSDED